MNQHEESQLTSAAALFCDGRQEASSGRGQSLLLIDDEDFHCRRLAHELERLGQGVSSTHTVNGAMAWAESNTVGLVAVEPVLAGGGWYAFLHLLREAGRSLQIVVTTAFPSSSLAVEAMKLGVLDVLHKPVEGRDLLAAFRGVCPRKNQDIDFSLSRVEWEHVNMVLRLSEGNISRAAGMLGISRQSLYNKLRKRP